MRYLPILLLPFLLSCNSHPNAPSPQLIKDLNLKQGSVISCGPPEQKFGVVDFDMTCNKTAKADFNLALELLHSFEYDEAEKMFAKVISIAPGCAMAYWGVAMSNFHPLWNPPTEAELQKGAKAIAIAKSIEDKSTREADYIAAIGLFYKDWDKTDHHTRCIYFEKAMDSLHLKYPGDPETSIFYALALDASANPTDKTYANQRKAGKILEALNRAQPNHPGIIHYIIHTYDYPGLAEMALPAARLYAAVAPSSAHALHMPSHIFTRLGLWDDAIQSNLKSVGAAQCYAESAGIPGHWDEELHGLDYLAYAYLQAGDNKKAHDQVAYLYTIKKIIPANFKVAYAFGSIPSRYVLENKQWKEAASLEMPMANFSWGQYPWQEANIHFARLLGDAHTGNKAGANTELLKLGGLRDTLAKQKDVYKLKQVNIQIKMGEAWVMFEEGKKGPAIEQMKLAADMEDSTDKHPVTAGQVLPARELLGDMLLQANEAKEALLAYETTLKSCPNRFNSLYGAGVAAERSGDKIKTAVYYKQLLSIAYSSDEERTEVVAAKNYLKERQ